MSDPHWREPNLFDAAEAKRRKEIGIAQVSSYPADEWVAKARAWTIGYAQQNGEVTSDDVHLHCPMPPGLHVNSMGAMFSGIGALEVAGMTSSKRPASHRRRILIYKPRIMT